MLWFYQLSTDPANGFGENLVNQDVTAGPAQVTKNWEINFSKGKFKRFEFDIVSS